MNDASGHYTDTLNEVLFRTFDGDISTKVVWLGDERWLLIDSEEPGLYMVELYPVRPERDD